MIEIGYTAQFYAVSDNFPINISSHCFFTLPLQVTLTMKLDMKNDNKVEKNIEVENDRKFKEIIRKC